MQVVNIKVIRNKQTGQSDGYGFIEFANRSSAEKILQTYNGTPMPNGAQNFRLNWASAGEKRSDDTPDHTIFVGDLASDVTDYMLQETFRARFSSVKGAKVVIDRLTGRTKGYGFVRFGDETEQLRAMTEMNGVLCSTRPMRIGPAANKNVVGGQQYTKGMSLNGACTIYIYTVSLEYLDLDFLYGAILRENNKFLEGCCVFRLDVPFLSLFFLVMCIHYLNLPDLT